MLIHTCQANTLAELMSKIRDMFGPEAAMLSVRRVPAGGSAGFTLEATVALERGAARKLHESCALSQAAPSGPAGLTNFLAGAQLIALVGPMGAGKTTTAAKIAAQRAGAGSQPVGVLSTDTQRPGGSALLLAYAAEFGLTATVANTASDLRNRIQRWNDRGPLVIDTRGCGPRDSLALERLGALLEVAGPQLKRYLVLSATEHPAVARECLEAFQAVNVSGVVLTRVDQATGIGHCLKIIRQFGIEIVLMGTGERVPEDLVRPSPNSLLALQPKDPVFTC